MLKSILVMVNGKEKTLYPVDCGPKTCGKCMYIAIRDKIISSMRYKPSHKDTKKFPCQCDVFHVDLDNHMVKSHTGRHAASMPNKHTMTTSKAF